jgi:riboflavin biosynthesis pyrimidine reductase
VVLDGRLRFPLQAKLLQGEPLPWIATHLRPIDPETHQQKRSALEERGARLLEIPSDDNGDLSLPTLLAKLADLGIDSLMVEGGSRVITSFLTSRLADQFVITIAPLFLGGLPAVQLPLPDGLTILPTPYDIGYDRLGDDLIVWGRLMQK